MQKKKILLLFFNLKHWLTTHHANDDSRLILNLKAFFSA
jgi:hypothetical protein